MRPNREHRIGQGCLYQYPASTDYYLVILQCHPWVWSSFWLSCPISGCHSFLAHSQVVFVGAELLENGKIAEAIVKKQILCNTVCLPVQLKRLVFNIFFKPFSFFSTRRTRKKNRIKSHNKHVSSFHLQKVRSSVWLRAGKWTLSYLYSGCVDIWKIVYL